MCLQNKVCRHSFSKLHLAINRWQYLCNNVYTRICLQKANLHLLVHPRIWQIRGEDFEKVCQIGICPILEWVFGENWNVLPAVEPSTLRSGLTIVTGLTGCRSATSRSSGIQSGSFIAVFCGDLWYLFYLFTFSFFIFCQKLQFIGPGC